MLYKQRPVLTVSPVFVFNVLVLPVNFVVKMSDVEAVNANNTVNEENVQVMQFALAKSYAVRDKRNVNERQCARNIGKSRVIVRSLSRSRTRS